MIRKGGIAAAGLLAAALLAGTAGCAPPAGGGSGPQTVSFQTAEQTGSAVTVEGIPDSTSIKKPSGGPTEFMIREESSGRRMLVVAPQGVTVPANITSATYVVVTGEYDPLKRALQATQVETRVPTREQQPGG